VLDFTALGEGERRHGSHTARATGTSVHAGAATTTRGLVEPKLEMVRPIPNWK
jgi:hypothetical protein